MKKYITIAALLAAGSTLANAETVIDARYNAGVTNGYNKGSGYTGFEFQLDSSTLLLSNQNYTIDSFGILSTNDSGVKLTTADSVVIYEVTDSGFSYFTSANVDSVSTYVLKGSDYESNDGHKYSNLSYAIVDFGDVEFGSSVEYAVFFSTTEAFLNNKSTFENATSFGDISSSLLEVRLSVGLSQPEANISGGTMYNGSGAMSAAYSSFVTATVTAIPEPSAFGLLAGVGALALVASRRRRSR